jgi:hypothetical protein
VIGGSRFTHKDAMTERLSKAARDGEGTQLVDEDQPQLIIDLRVAPEVDVGLEACWILDETHEAIVVTSEHSIAAGLVEHEVDQLVSLGDREDESRAWLNQRSDSKWVAILATGAHRTAANVEGIVRVTMPPCSSEMLRDLGVLVDMDFAAVAADLAEKLGIESIHPFIDCPTLDITPLGSATQQTRFANLFRLLLVMTITNVRAAQELGIGVQVALINPKVVKYIPFTGVPFHLPEYGVMEYKLSEATDTPMLTQVLVAFADEIVAAMKNDPSEFLQRVTSVMTQNGMSIDLEVPGGKFVVGSP